MIFRWPPYFPQNKNLQPLTTQHIEKITNVIQIVKNKLPHKIYTTIDNLSLYYDNTLPFGVLGYTTFFKPNRIIFSTQIAEAILWTNIYGKPNNEIAMNTVIHELTHLQQFRDWKWYGWIVVNNPFVKNWTIEKWADENGDAAYSYLRQYYRR